MTVKCIFGDLQTVVEITSLAEATVQKLVRDGEFPKPRQISARRVGWLVSDIEAWASERPVSELPPPPNTGSRRRSAASQS